MTAKMTAQQVIDTVLANEDKTSEVKWRTILNVVRGHDNYRKGPTVGYINSLIDLLTKARHDQDNTKLLSFHLGTIMIGLAELAMDRDIDLNLAAINDACTYLHYVEDDTRKITDE